MTDYKHIGGGAELQAFLDQLPAKMGANIMRSAMRQGANVIAAEAKQNVPVGAPSSTNKKRYGGYAGALRDSIRVSTKNSKGKVIASVKAGGKTKRGANVYYAHIVEFTGAVAHVIKAKGKGALSFGGFFGKSVKHPGMRAKPFMRPALDAKANAALQAVGDQVKKRLTKEGLNAPAVEIEDR